MPRAWDSDLAGRDIGSHRKNLSNARSDNSISQRKTSERGRRGKVEEENHGAEETHKALVREMVERGIIDAGKHGSFEISSSLCKQVVDVFSRLSRKDSSDPYVIRMALFMSVWQCYGLEYTNEIIRTVSSIAAFLELMIFEDFL